MKTIFTIIATIFCASVFSQAGGLDSAFATNGKFVNVSSYPYYISSTQATAIQKDGKILIAGYGNDVYNSVGQDFYVSRLNVDGTLDNSFGNSGRVYIDFSTPSYYSNDNAYGLAVQADGKILVTGNATGYAYIDSSQTYNYSDIAIARLNIDGSLDNSFNGTGKTVIDLTKITTGGSPYRSSTDYSSAITVKPNGKIEIAGSAYVYDNFGSASYDAIVLQLNNNGSRDTLFATAGVLIFKKTFSDETLQAITLQKDGKIVATGSSFISSGTRELLAVRVKANGTIDSSFNGTGSVYIDLANGSYDEGTAISLQTSGKILLGGNTTNTAALIRLNTNGTPDKSFMKTGISLVSRSFITYQKGMAIQPDGKVIQTGTAYRSSFGLEDNFKGGNNFFILRYNINGTVDSSFGTYGFSIVDFGNYTNGYEDYNQACTIQPDGKVIAVGNNIYPGFAGIARILTTGKTFGVTAPSSQSDTAVTGNCNVVVTNIDPVLYPDTSLSLVKYVRYNSNTYPPLLIDSGYGSLSGKTFPIGNTIATYSSTVDGLQRGVFSVNVSGGTPAGALDFDGVNDRVFINSYLDPVNSVSYGQYAFEAWIKVRGYNANGSVIFGNERNNNSGIIVQLNNKGYVTTYHPSVGYVVSKSKVALNKWMHIAFTQNNSSLDLYVNGKFVQTLLSAPYLHTSTYNNFYLGAYTDDDNNFSRFFNGEIDEVRVWGQAICKAQIQNNLHCEVADYTQGLLAHFSFNQGLASCENQSVTTLNGGYVSGTLQNFALTGPTSNWVAGYISGSCTPFVPLSITNYPSSVNVQATGDSCGATVNFGVTYTAGCSDNATVTYSQNPGTYFPVGNTYVSATVQDGFGNSQTVYFPVNVTETTPPALVVKDTALMLNENGYVYVNPNDLIVSLTDNCTPGYNINYYTSGNTYLTCSNKGVNPVTITAYDQSGNSTTKTAYVTVAPYAGTATVETIPNPQQYSDYTTVIATLPGAQNLYYNGCLYGSQVTFKVGGKEQGTVILTPDGYGNLIGAFSYKLADIFPKKLTAVFSNVDSSVYKLASNTVITTINGAPENAVVDYVESQLITTSASKLTIPVATQLTDSADGSRGDIRKAVVTFLIQPVTPGATVVGSNTLTVSAFELVSSDKTSGVAKGSFTVNMGRNTSAKFNVITTVSNYYTGSTTATVYVSKSGSSQIAADSKVALNNGLQSSWRDDDFGVTVLPNPSKNEFSLQVNSSHVLDKVNIRISDAAGRVIETFSNVNAGNVVKLGANYQPGVYMAEIGQGNNRKSYKLIKL